jgi:hypothetical protein
MTLERILNYVFSDKNTTTMLKIAIWNFFLFILYLILPKELPSKDLIRSAGSGNGLDLYILHHPMIPYLMWGNLGVFFGAYSKKLLAKRK